MQDTFWWIFLNKFDRDKDHNKENKDLLFDRIADSFVALFTSIHTDVKDKFLSVYPDCLAQAVYAAYYEAFSESRSEFDSQFKQNLINLIYEWVTGLKPLPGTWNRWNVDKVILQGSETDNNAAAAAQQMMQAAALNKSVDYKMDIESFGKMVEKLGSEPRGLSAAPTPVEKTSSAINPSGRNSTQPAPHSGAINDISANIHVHKSVSSNKESHQIGPGPQYERVRFNTSGRSPLVSHYLHMRQLRSFQQAGKKVRRTEIAKLPDPGPTYDELIQSTLAMSQAMSREYQRICDDTNQAIADIEKKKRDTNKEIDNLRKELLFVKNPLDLKILTERIMGLKDRDRDTPLLDRQSPEAGGNFDSQMSDSGDY